MNRQKHQIVFGLSAGLVLACAQAQAVLCTTEAELQAAVENAANGDEICVAEGMYALTKTLALTNRNVTLRGVASDGLTSADRAKVVLNGGGSRRVLTSVEAGLILRDLTVSNGCHTLTKADTDCGGGVYANGAQLFSNCVFTCNRALGKSTGNGGGAVGLLSSGETVFRDCLFTDNSSETSGGAVHPQNATSGPKLYDCTFRGNSALYYGGAVSTRNSGRIELLSGCTFVGNTSAEMGGAVYGASFGAVSNCTFLLNTAKKGGVFCTDRSSSVSFFGCHFLTNSVTESGGAIFTTVSGKGRNSIRLYDCLFAGNSASSGGAIAFGSGTFNSLPYMGTIPYATNTVFRGNHAVTGGAIHGSFQHLVDCRFEENYQTNGNAASGGAIAYTSVSTHADYDEFPPLAEDCQFVSNRCTGTHSVNNTGGTTYYDGGAAVYGESPDRQMAFKRCRFTANAITNVVIGAYNHAMVGGAIFTRGAVRAEDCVFEKNVGFTYGGALFAGSVTGGLRRCTFVNNVQCASSNIVKNSGWYGQSSGIVYLNTANGTSVIEDCRFLTNTVFGGSGSAVYAKAGALRMTNCRMEENRCPDDCRQGAAGGAVFAASAVRLEMDRCAFVRNRTEHYSTASGGGLSAEGGGFVRNCLFLGNVVTNAVTPTKSTGWGGGAYVKTNPFEFSNCTFADNVARYLGGGLYAGSACGVTNCVFYRNIQTYSSAAGTRDDLSTVTGTTVRNTFGSVATSGYLDDGVNGCIVKDENPFCSDKYVSYAVSEGCGRDAGLLLGWMTADSLDLGGHSRVVSPAVDFGCYEWHPTLGMCILIR